MNVEDLRSGERFILADPIPGSFGASEITLLNISMAGAQIAHTQPLRLGTTARLLFRWNATSAAREARVVWSHLSREKNGTGKHLYVSGLKIESADVEFATAVNALFTGGLLQRDTESLERKRQRMIERERQRSTATIKIVK